MRNSGNSSIVMAKSPAKDSKKPTEPKAAGATIIMALHVLVSVTVVTATIAIAGSHGIVFIDLRDSLHGATGPASIILVLLGLIIYAVALSAEKARHAAFELSIQASRQEIPGAIAAQKSQLDEAFAVERARIENSISAFSQNISDITASISKLENKVETFIGAELTRLNAENDALKAELDAHYKANETIVAAEIENLRQINAELNEKITRWAVNSVEAKLDRKNLQVA